VKVRLSTFIALFLLLLGYYLALTTAIQFFTGVPVEWRVVVVFLIIGTIWVLGRAGKLFGRVRL
jgi:hypothetical protein